MLQRGVRVCPGEWDRVGRCYSEKSESVQRSERTRFWTIVTLPEVGFTLGTAVPQVQSTPDLAGYPAPVPPAHGKNSMIPGYFVVKTT